MIVMARNMPDYLLYLETLLQRNSQDTSLYELYQRTKVGYLGESRVDREWADIFLEQKHYLFHDYQITNLANFTHQIDTILFANPLCCFLK